jgi:hypothetical protein
MFQPCTVTFETLLAQGERVACKALRFLHTHQPSSRHECEIQAFSLGTSFAESLLSFVGQRPVAALPGIYQRGILGPQPDSSLRCENLRRSLGGDLVSEPESSAVGRLRLCIYG